VRKDIPEQKKGDKKLSLHPLSFEEALRDLLETEPPKEKQEKKTPAKRRKRSIEKASDHSASS